MGLDACRVTGSGLWILCYPLPCFLPVVLWHLCPRVIILFSGALHTLSSASFQLAPLFGLTLCPPWRILWCTRPPDKGRLSVHALALGNRAAVGFLRDCGSHMHVQPWVAAPRRPGAVPAHPCRAPCFWEQGRAPGEACADFCSGSSLGGGWSALLFV